MIESRCGLRCSDCSFREAMGCKGCVNMEKPFWADSCPVKSCCERKACSIAANAMTSFVLYYILLLTTWSKAITAQESSNAKSGVKIMASSKE